MDPEYDRITRHYSLPREEREARREALKDIFGRDPLGIRLTNAMNRNGISTIEEILTLTTEELHAIIGKGVKSHQRLNSVRRAAEEETEQRVKVIPEFRDWKYEDHVRIEMLDGDLAVLTADGKPYIPVDLTFRYSWCRGEWLLVWVDAAGPLVSEYGELGELVDVEYNDPIKGDTPPLIDGGTLRAPEWVLKLAARRAELIPNPPEA